jgi:hypothetical protein
VWDAHDLGGVPGDHPPDRTPLPGRAEVGRVGGQRRGPERARATVRVEAVADAVLAGRDSEPRLAELVDARDPPALWVLVVVSLEHAVRGGIGHHANVGLGEQSDDPPGVGLVVGRERAGGTRGAQNSRFSRVLWTRPGRSDP